MEVLGIYVNRKSFAGESFARASNYLHEKPIQGAEVKGPPGATEMQAGRGEAQDQRTKAHTEPPPVLQAEESRERAKKSLKAREPRQDSLQDSE